jgi:hypothetical protein
MSDLTTARGVSYDGTLLDITAPAHGAGITIRADGKVLWVHVDGIAVLRVCQIPHFDLDDMRPAQPNSYDVLVVEPWPGGCTWEGNVTGQEILKLVAAGYQVEHRDAGAEVIPAQTVNELLGRSPTIEEPE